MLKFDKILIANRGEIAVRIIRACRDLGIKTVAVYSEADRYSRHVELADEAICIGPPPSVQSYLVMQNVIKAAKSTGAQAVHPGYGFLSENAEFARAVDQAGLTFIGPPASAIAMMGDKMAARAAMQQSGVPVVPGTVDPIESEEQCRQVIEKIGLPVLIKAAGGGGGKGMRVVHSMDDIERSLRSAVSEAGSAFGDSRVYIEKYISEPRHIEIQIFADIHGNCCYLGERECSIQRRHQKVIEEAPSPIVDQAMRRKMGEAAVAAARACGYINAGTVEFLVDGTGEFYFLEMNTRLQVEHPVTEMVTGIDMVVEQIRVASGLPLSFTQDDIKISGHAIECRIYAEDPATFLPAVGKLKKYREPSGPGIRVDSGVYEGAEISVYYDPLIAKLVASGGNREIACARMRRALKEYTIAGVVTNLDFHRKVLENEKFAAGKISTHFIEQNYSGPDDPDPKELQLAAIAAVLADHRSKRSVFSHAKSTGSRWLEYGRRMGLRAS